ncbi:MAG: Arc family DNA-binding protein [Propionibacteriaceae bacterium]|nr:Arc family DNA-binding protein [Propionibacteriaceae bacterium]
MAAIAVRGLDDEVHRALIRRARAHGRSMEAEVRQILTDTVRADLVTPNVLVEFFLASREEPVELPIPERTYEAPRVEF